MAKLRKRGKGQPARVFERADAALLVEENFHPLLDMIQTAKKLEGAERVAAADKIAKYFYPGLKAVDMQMQGTQRIVIELGGLDD